MRKVKRNKARVTLALHCVNTYINNDRNDPGNNISYKITYAPSENSGLKVIKLFFMLNSAGHEIFSANKYKNANNIWHFHIY